VPGLRKDSKRLANWIILRPLVRKWGSAYLYSLYRYIVIFSGVYFRSTTTWTWYKSHIILNVKFNSIFNVLIVHQYSETNVMHFLFNLLRIKGLYMFRGLLFYPHEAPYKHHLVDCGRVMSVACTRCSQLTYHARNIPSAASVAPPEDEQAMLESCRVP
jgi:hypothetical protein